VDKKRPAEDVFVGDKYDTHKRHEFQMTRVLLTVRVELERSDSSGRQHPRPFMLVSAYTEVWGDMVTYQGTDRVDRLDANGRPVWVAQPERDYVRWTCSQLSAWSEPVRIELPPAAVPTYDSDVRPDDPRPLRTEQTHRDFEMLNLERKEEGKKNQ
jgi:hypothetical protein